MKPQLFVPGVSAAGLLVIGHCVGTLMQQRLEPQWLALAVLTLLTGSFTIKIPSVAARLSVSETFVFASVLLFGTCVGTITVALEIIVIIIAGTRREPLRILFNISSAALAIWLSSHAFYATSGIQPLAEREAPLGTLILPLAVLAVSYFVLNSGMIAVAVGLERRESALAIWRTNFLPLAVNYLGGASLAALFVSYTRTIDLVAFGVILPLLILSYLTFKYSFRRVEDATQHVDEMRRLYLSTIETLATAIDAKDQVTHGHIRRVQQFALGLAREIGVQDQSQMQALEAAALLHDTGKLVVPEHILNKPGKLTHGEFEKMKAHASVGADILSSISFPYPVVPIVRHHHENWDGSGYPDGLRGTNIPIGARILSVVDCFDALTSDRPYRPRMTDKEALAVLMQRRGVMYDPLVVDTFAACWQKLAAAVEAPHPPRERAFTARVIEGSRELNTSSDPHSQLAEPLAAIFASAMVRTGAELAVLFMTDADRDQLLSVAVRARDGALSENFAFPLGWGVSGWVAVNGTAIVNADPALDFGTNGTKSHLVRTICVPLFLKRQVAGVVSLYTTDMRGFSDDDKAYIEDLVASLDTETCRATLDTVFRVRKAAISQQPTIH